jgi:LysM repeat protein
MASYQEQVCLTPAACKICPVAQVHWNGPLPAHIRGYSTLSAKRPAKWLLLSSALILVACFVIWQVFSASPLKLPGFSWFGFQTASASEGLQPEPSPVGAVGADGVRPAVGVDGIRPAPAQELQASPTVIPATVFAPAVSAATPTATPAATAAVQEETPAGQPEPVQLLSLHIVQPGESLATIAKIYRTSPEVLLAVNESFFALRNSFEAREASAVRIEEASLEPGLVAIVIPGRTNAAGLPVLRVVEVSSENYIEAIGGEYQVSLEEIIEYNAVVAGEWIPAGRLLILPAIG